MLVANASRGTVLGQAIEVAQTAAQRVKGLLGRECLEDGQGLLFRGAESMHTLFMRFPIDIVYADKNGKLVMLAEAVGPFKLVAAPLRCYYALELPAGVINQSKTRVGDRLSFDQELELAEAA